MSSKIVQFMEVTGASADDATRWLEIAAGNIDDAVMYYFEEDAGQQQEVAEPPQRLAPIHTEPLQPAPKPHQSAQPPQKRGLFGLGKKQVEAPPPVSKEPTRQEIAEPKPSTKSQPFVDVPEEKPANDNIYQPKFDQPDDGDKLFVDGGVKEGGSGTQVYAPPKDYELKIDRYDNGCLIEERFFAFSDNNFKRVFEDMIESEQVPLELFEKFPPEEKPKPNQKINATINEHSGDYDESSAQQVGASPNGAPKYEWDANEKGRTIGGVSSSTRKSSEHQQPVKQASEEVNTNFTVERTSGSCTLKIRAEQPFIVRADPTTTVLQLLTSLQANGGLPGVAKLGAVTVRRMTGEVIEHGTTIAQAGLAATEIIVTW